MVIMKKRISIYLIKNILLLFPFFEIGLFSSFESIGKGIIYVYIGYLFALARIIVTLYAFIKYKKKFSTSIGKAFLLFLLLRIIACFRSQDVMLKNILLGSFTLTGLLLLSERMIYQNPEDYIKSFAVLMGAYSVINLIFVLLFPYGIYNQNVSLFGNAYSVYFLGGKNGAFFPYLFFLFASVILSKTIKGVISKRVIFLNILLLIGAVMLKSANTIICLFIALACLLVEKYFSFFPRIVTKNKLFFFVVLISIVLLTDLRNIFLGPLVKLFGKDITLSGRTVLWSCAADYIKKSPIWGNGTGVTYEMKLTYETRYYPQAHSTYLDMIAKYGIMTLIPFVNVFFVALKKTTNFKLRKYGAFCSVFIVLAMLHSIIDDISLYDFLSVCMLGYSANFLLLKRCKRTEYQG